MVKPLFSVVIPTRNRPDTLAYCLKTCLEQDFDDYEIIVCDNAGAPETEAVIKAADSSRILYVRSPTPLAMSANWELALSKATGAYVMVIGDDDGLMPFALRELARIVRDRDMPQAVQWRCAHYNWPTIVIASEANYLALPLTRELTEKNGREELARAAQFEIGHDRLPMINTAIIRNDVVEDLRQRTGRVFNGLYPDVYSAYAFAFLCETYISLSVPMHVAGLSGRSNGVAALMDQGAGPITQEFYRLQRDSGYWRHPTVPDYELFPVHSDDSFQHAKDLLFPDDETLALDRKTMLLRYLAAIPDVAPAERDRIDRAIRASIADRPDLVEWYENSAPEFPPCPPFRLRPDRLGFDGKFLLVDTARFGVQNIHDAVRLSADLLQFDPSGIVYDLSGPEEAALALETTLNELETVRETLVERSFQLEAVLADLGTSRQTLIERTGQLEAVLAETASTRETLIERTFRLETALAELAALREQLKERDVQLRLTRAELAFVRETLSEQTQRLDAAFADLAAAPEPGNERAHQPEAAPATTQQNLQTQSADPPKRRLVSRFEKVLSGRRPKDSDPSDIGG